MKRLKRGGKMYEEEKDGYLKIKKFKKIANRVFW